MIDVSVRVPEANRKADSIEREHHMEEVPAGAKDDDEDNDDDDDATGNDADADDDDGDAENARDAASVCSATAIVLSAFVYIWVRICIYAYEDEYVSRYAHMSMYIQTFLFPSLSAAKAAMAGVDNSSICLHMSHLTCLWYV